ncbi:hypothetical protein BN946_scf185043.g42 [Trametes cinnabarina]|uniref:Uncharacterized protein n=1 Tax=Pycnoporus cinnabarinus TaxID=5643 RepID=A0A060SNI1_PYCCI|nr:hypothetical protein BN946_scf185043.g42 [Trametes cinnabarina]
MQGGRLIPQEGVDRQEYIDQHVECVARWKLLLKTDPERVVRVLTSTGWGTETIDGDTAWDAPYIIELLEEASLEPQTTTWKNLVNAGSLLHFANVL